MDTTTSNPPHALSGHSPTLFNVVVQFADMDMLRTLALTSQSMYEALQHCRFDHLTVVVLEAPVLEDRQQVVYNGADPVPADTFRLPLNNPATTSNPGSTIPNIDIWRRRSTVRNNYGHNLTIPDYARNFMARAQSVELVVYRRRLGTRISALFTDNAHHLKHGGHTTLYECASCFESNESATTTTQYRLHLACPPTSHAQHCNTNYGHARGDAAGNTGSSPDNGCTLSRRRSHEYLEDDDGSTGPSSDNDCIFSKHRSHEYPEDDRAESRRLRFHKTPSHPLWSAHLVPYKDLPSLQLNLLCHTTDTGLENDNGTKRKGRTRNTFYFSIAAEENNTYFHRTRFHNLPLTEQQAPTTSLKIHIVDCVSFGSEDWTNAIPGCTVQPMQTWIISDDTSAPRHHHTPSIPTSIKLVHLVVPNMNDRDHIGHNFPRLTSLVLQFTPLSEVNGCGIDDFNIPTSLGFAIYSDVSHFFIDDAILPLPCLRHFSVIGTLLDCDQFAKIVFDNALTSSLNVDPGPHPAHLLKWLTDLNQALDKMEGLETSPSDDDNTFAPFFHPTTLQRVVTIPRPHRKYNFSFDFASPRLACRCPHEVLTLAHEAFTYIHSQRNVALSSNRDFSPFDQHRMTCALIHDRLAKFYWDHTNDSGNGNTNCTSPSESLPLQLVFPVPTDIRSQEASTILTIAKLAQRTLTHLKIRCHYCSHTNPGSTVFPGASTCDHTTTYLPSSTNVPLTIVDLPQGDTGENEDGDVRMRSTQYNKKMYVRLRQLLNIPPHVMLHL